MTYLEALSYYPPHGRPRPVLYGDMPPLWLRRRLRERGYVTETISPPYVYGERTAKGEQLIKDKWDNIRRSNPDRIYWLLAADFMRGAIP